MNNGGHSTIGEELAAGPCPACRYDLRGTPRGFDGAFQCPECGRSWVEQELAPAPSNSRVPWDCVRCIGLNVAIAFLVIANSNANIALIAVVTSLLWLLEGVWIFIRSVASDPTSARFVTTWKMAVIVAASGSVNAALLVLAGGLLRSADC